MFISLMIIQDIHDFFIVNKSDAISIFLNFKKRVETFFNPKSKAPKQIEEKSMQYLENLATLDIGHYISCPYTYEQTAPVNYRHYLTVENGFTLGPSICTYEISG